MIISRTPFRISFAGGGSDLKEYYAHYGGGVLSVTINKYVYLSMHPFFYENKFLLKYSSHELVNRVDDIRHKIIREIFKDYKIRGVDFNSSADVPAGTGLGSSSGFTVGLINLCNEFTGCQMTKHQIARYACAIEIERLSEPIGKQDHYACAFGGFNYIHFHPEGSVTVEKINMSVGNITKMESRMLMFYLGKTRSASSILKQQKENTVKDKKVIANLHRMVQLSEDLKREFLKGNINALGEILHEGWCYKKELAPCITSKKIDFYYDKAIKNGAKGGKLLGAGKGGFLLIYANKNHHEKIRKGMEGLFELQFKVEDQGTTIIYKD